MTRIFFTNNPITVLHKLIKYLGENTKDAIKNRFDILKIYLLKWPNIECPEDNSSVSNLKLSGWMQTLEKSSNSLDVCNSFETIKMQ